MLRSPREQRTKPAPIRRLTEGKSPRQGPSEPPLVDARQEEAGSVQHLVTRTCLPLTEGLHRSGPPIARLVKAMTYASPPACAGITKEEKAVKRLSTCLAIFLASALTAPAFAQVGKGLSGPHYNLNIIGVPKDKNVDMTNSDRHTIFVPLQSGADIGRQV